MKALGSDTAKKIRYNPTSDVLYFLFAEGQEARFEEPIPGVHVEFDESDNLIGVEVLNASRIIKNLFDQYPINTN